MMQQYYYISSGRKNAMFTLRCATANTVTGFHDDHYLCNLSTDEAKATEKGRDYFERLHGEGVNTAERLVMFCEDPEASLFKRRGKMSVADTRRIEMIESGLFPYGKHQGMEIAKAPDSYVLYFSDKLRASETEKEDVVFVALASACMGVALERGLIAKRQQIRDERLAVDMLSNHVGKIGQRMDFTGELFMVFEKKPEHEYDSTYFVSKLRVGDDIIVYRGSKPLGALGDKITVRGTVKAHDVWKDVKTTRINRPA